MRSDIKIGVIAACAVGALFLYRTIQAPASESASAFAATTDHDEKMARAMEVSLKMISKLSADVSSLRDEVRRSVQASHTGIADRVENRRDQDHRPPAVRSDNSGPGPIGGSWQRGSHKKRPDEEIECSEWISGKRDTYLHSKEARIHVNPGGFTSQYRQDKQLYLKFFSKMDRPGVYLDIAANHYKVISNTYFIDRCLGWDGLCVEPNPVYHDGLLQNRSCAVVPRCISDKVETVQFTFPKGFWEAQLGGVGGGQFKNRRPDDKNFEDVSIECVTVAGLLADAGVTHVDFFSIDVEGHEPALLRGIDFSKVTFDVILCESHCGEVLKANGYAKIAMPDMAGGDKVFLRKDGPFGHMLPEVPIE